MEFPIFRLLKESEYSPDFFTRCLFRKIYHPKVLLVFFVVEILKKACYQLSNLKLFFSMGSLNEYSWLVFCDEHS